MINNILQLNLLLKVISVASLSLTSIAANGGHGKHQYLNNKETIIETKKVTIDSIYNHFLHQNSSLSGEMEFDLVIDALGSVKSSKLIYSDVNNPSFERKLSVHIFRSKFKAFGNVDRFVILPLFFPPQVVVEQEKRLIRNIPLPVWWDDVTPKAKPFSTRKEIQKARADDERLFYKRTLLTIDQHPDNHKLITAALYYAPFRKNITTKESIILAEFFIKNYMDWEEHAYKYCIDCKKKAGMVAEMVSGLVNSYCNTNKTKLAINLIDNFLISRNTEIDIRPKASIFHSLTYCIAFYNSSSRIVIRRLEEGVNELGSEAKFHAREYLYQVEAKIARYYVDKEGASPCSLVRLESNHMKDDDVRLALNLIWFRDNVSRQEWGKHLTKVRELILYQSAQAMPIIKQIFKFNYNHNKYPEWRGSNFYSDVIYNMACIRDDNYIRILKEYFFGNTKLSKNEQIHRILEVLVPEEKGFSLVTKLAPRKDHNIVEAIMTFSHLRVPPHGHSILFEEIEFDGNKYWLPIAKINNWVS